MAACHALRDRIVKTGLSIGMESVNDLLDTAVDKELRVSIDRLLKQFVSEGEVQSYKQLRLRRMGPYALMDVNIVVPSKVSVSVAHQIGERVRWAVLKQFSGVSEVLVHVTAEDQTATATGAADSAHSHDATHTHDHDHKTAAPIPGGETERKHKLMRPQSEIEADVRRVVSKFPSILGVTHFTAHWLNHKLAVQIEVVMSEDLKIVEARALASRVQSSLIEQISDVDDADVHLVYIESLRAFR